jgi:hypothetical protein
MKDQIRVIVGDKITAGEKTLEDDDSLDYYNGKAQWVITKKLHVGICASQCADEGFPVRVEHHPACYEKGDLDDRLWCKHDANNHISDQVNTNATPKRNMISTATRDAWNKRLWRR